MFEPSEREALRACALLCWQGRDKLSLTPHQVDQVLIAWQAVGTPEEGELAAETLAARAAAERKQAEFNAILDSPRT